MDRINDRCVNKRQDIDYDLRQDCVCPLFLVSFSHIFIPEKVFEYFTGIVRQ